MLSDLHLHRIMLASELRYTMVDNCGSNKGSRKVTARNQERDDGGLAPVDSGEGGEQ